MAAAEQNVALGCLWIADGQQRRGPTFARFAQGRNMEIRVRRVRVDESPKVGQQVREAEGEVDLLGRVRNVVDEMMFVVLAVGPLPGAAIDADDRAVRAHRAAFVREADLQPTARCAADAEIPPEPPLGRVAQIGSHEDPLPVDPLDQDIAARIVGVDLNRHLSPHLASASKAAFRPRKNRSCPRSTGWLMQVPRKTM